MTTNRNRVSVGRLLLSGVVAVVLGGAVFAGTLGAASPDQAAIQAVVKEAIGAEFALFTPPDANEAVGPATIAKMNARAREVLSSLYAEPLRSQRIATYQTGINQLGAGSDGSNGAIQTDGGATAFSNWKLTIRGTSANVSVRANVFIEDSPSAANATPARIQGELDYTFTLGKDSGQWLITTMTSEFVPGFEP